MGGFNVIDLSRLPPPDVVQVTDFEAIVAARKADVVARLRLHSPTLADEIAAILSLESDPMVKIQQTGAYRELVHFARVNDAARAVMVAFAYGGDLEHLGSLYGVTRMTGEDDARLRLRVTLAPDAWEGAGPAAGIVFHAMTADVRVKHVGLTRVRFRADIGVTILSTVGNGAASDALIDVVRDRLQADDVRLMTDVISVRSADVLPYTIAVTLRVPRGVDPARLKAQAETGLQRLAFERHRIGARVPLSLIDAAAGPTGVEDVVRSSPTASIEPVTAYQAPFASSITVATEVV
jgi:phage-related baseplate assembly protein